jgi:regulator of protease activity HflC (stomatin/prohibitin superfamily)
MASADDAAMAEANMVGMVMPQELPNEEDNVDNNIEALFGDSSDGDVVVPTTTDEQVALLASFETVHHEQGTRWFMAAEREALVAMLVVCANAAREATRVAAQEEAAHAAARADELAEEAVADATTQEEMARDHRR